MLLRKQAGSSVARQSGCLISIQWFYWYAFSSAFFYMFTISFKHGYALICYHHVADICPFSVVYRQVTIIDWRHEYLLKPAAKLSIVDNLGIMLFAYAA